MLLVNARSDETLASEVDRPMFDKTGLTKKFDFKLEFAPERMDPDLASNPKVEIGLPLPAALQSQLGLRLEARKAPTEILVIDQVDRTPTGN